eukprot:gnl/Trimastix_PCT/985.p1 GENE.gnl/Trimastix_PCT/985~~gnl/Trimastix_PCT/985.p1  ORF type:complete len:318 (+),score=50.73 gnl/Trimastix_PCT/985:91-1044(+)
MGGSKSKPSFKFIPDQYKSYPEVERALRNAGLESSQLIFAVDFSKSNTWTGERTYGGRSLHDSSAGKNPYEEVIDILGRTLEPFDDDHLIPAFGFGDNITRDQRVFPFRADSPCHGFMDVLAQYKNVLPAISMAGPTTLEPIIRVAMEIVRQTREYHILVVITDGQVSDKHRDAQAIVDATSLPLSIICIGVGDGPWEEMIRFDDELPRRRFDNFQFVNFTEIKRKFARLERPDLHFALNALMEIPDQVRLIKRLSLFSNCPGHGNPSNWLVPCPVRTLPPMMAVPSFPGAQPQGPPPGMPPQAYPGPPPPAGFVPR